MIYLASYHLQCWRRAAALISVALLICLSMAKVFAQSTELDFPTPVRASSIEAVIAARDVGDARLTRHFYALTGTPGDLAFTVESKNLNGDIDLFTAAGLRPLAKVSLYAGEAAATVSKSIYLRRREALILRIEARSANDDEGRYRIHFEGAFEPVIGETTTVADESVSTPTAAQNVEARTNRNTKRVSSVGARIEEERTETSTASDATTNNADAVPPPVTPPVVAETKPPPVKPPSVKLPRVRRSNTRAARVKPPATTSKRTATVVTPTPPSSPPAEAGAKLIIETRDGMRVERYMSVVRRVTVENGQIVVVLKNGKVERQPLSGIQRVAIEP